MKEISLDGIWKLRADRIEDNPFGIKERMEWNMNIPGDVHDTLIKNNTIPDPYYGMNELDIQFIGRGDWTIYRTFFWKKEDERTFIRLEKVDTVARLFINGECIELENLTGDALILGMKRELSRADNSERERRMEKIKAVEALNGKTAARYIKGERITE